VQEVWTLSFSIQNILKLSPYGHLKHPKDILQKSWEQNQELGSSTFVVVTLPTDEAKLYSSYVGDSGYCILRSDTEKEEKFSIIFESEPQQRRFNYPYQLGWGDNGDHPKVAISKSHDVRDGDLVVLGSDGLFDNVSSKNVSMNNVAMWHHS
jgi:protein phosphatase PTC7